MLSIAVLTTTSLVAQNEGRSWELGTFVGASFYHGDATKGFVPSTIPSLGVSLRQNRNLRFSWQTTLSYDRLNGSTEGLSKVFPKDSEFVTNVLALSLGGEFHWLPYGLNYTYLGTRAWTPYIGGGLGVGVAWQERFLLSPKVYFTAGLKYQLRPRIQVAVAYTWCYYMSDRVDALGGSSVLDAPFGQRANLLRHGDATSRISVGLSWKLKYKHINCN